MKVLKTIGARLEVVSELMGFLWQRRLWWLLPMVFMLVIVGLLLVFAQATGLAPFIYTLF